VCNAFAPFESSFERGRCLADSAMGKNPLYPFEIPRAVVGKLGFIHRVIRESGRDRQRES
jgi:hypothetical protein